MCPSSKNPALNVLINPCHVCTASCHGDSSDPPSWQAPTHTHARAYTASAENGADSLSNMMTNSLTLQTWQMCLCNVFVFSMKMKMKAAQRRPQEVRKGEWKANSFTGTHSAGVFRAPGVIVRGQSGATGSSNIQAKGPWVHNSAAVLSHFNVDWTGSGKWLFFSLPYYKAKS